MQNQVFYLTGIIKKSYFGGEFAFSNENSRWPWLAASTMISFFSLVSTQHSHTVAAAAAVDDGDSVQSFINSSTSLKHSTPETDVVRKERNCVAGRRRTMLIISQ